MNHLPQSYQTGLSTSNMRLLLGFVLSTFWLREASLSRVYTNHWAVRIPGGPVDADELASKYGFTNLGQVRIFLYLFCGYMMGNSFKSVQSP